MINHTMRLHYTLHLAYLNVLTCNTKAKSCRKPGVGTKCVYVTYNSQTRFKVKRSKLQGHVSSDKKCIILMTRWLYSIQILHKYHP